MAPTARAATLGLGPSRSPKLATASPNSSPSSSGAPKVASVSLLIFLWVRTVPGCDHALPKMATLATMQHIRATPRVEVRGHMADPAVVWPIDGPTDKYENDGLNHIPFLDARARRPL